jgi:protein-S-isoprenylcysteine O-methyltransferase Ste14
MPTPWMQRTGRTPGGVIGAVLNVVVCGVIAVALPVMALTAGRDPGHIAFAVVGFVIAVGLEVVFVRILRNQLARGRG